LHRLSVKPNASECAAQTGRGAGRLEPGHRDHALTGDWKDYRDCHIKPDLVLIYQKPDADTLRLVRLGSHSELSL